MATHRGATFRSTQHLDGTAKVWFPAPPPTSASGVGTYGGLKIKTSTVPGRRHEARSPRSASTRAPQAAAVRRVRSHAATFTSTATTSGLRRSVAAYDATTPLPGPISATTRGADARSAARSA